MAAEWWPWWWRFRRLCPKRKRGQGCVPDYQNGVCFVCGEKA